MSPLELVDLISIVCKTNEPYKDKYVHEQRIDCVEHFANCMVKSGGKIHIGDLKECHHEWSHKLKIRGNKYHRNP